MERNITISKYVKLENYYSASRSGNDIAILVLASSVKYNAYVRPACLPTSSETTAWTTTSKLCAITGWGHLKRGGAQPNILQEAKVPLVTDSTCRRQYRGLVEEIMLCAGNAQGGVDTCQGDSGGPMVCQRKDGSYALVGITSFGRGCATHYGVYTDVSEFMPWIRNKLKENNINI